MKKGEPTRNKMGKKLSESESHLLAKYACTNTYKEYGSGRWCLSSTTM